MAQAAGYAWDDESLEIIQEWKEWKDKFSVFLQQLEQNGPANTKYPKKPKRSIESLSPTKSSEPLFGKHLHDYLVKKITPGGIPIMISTTRFTAADLANLDVVKQWLRTGFLNLEQRQTTLLASYLNLGDWLIVAYDLFHTEKLYGRVVGTWPDWLEASQVGIHERQDREIREMTKLLQGHPKFRMLNMSFYDLKKHKRQIEIMLKDPQFSAFWAQP